MAPGGVLEGALLMLQRRSCMLLLCLCAKFLLHEVHVRLRAVCSLSITLFIPIHLQSTSTRTVTLAAMQAYLI
jgi:hypothetical protein